MSRVTYQQFLSFRDENARAYCVHCRRGIDHGYCWSSNIEAQEQCEKDFIAGLARERGTNFHEMFELCAAVTWKYSAYILGSKTEAAADLFTKITGMRTVIIERSSNWMIWARAIFGWWNIPNWGEPTHVEMFRKVYPLNDRQGSAPLVFLERDIFRAMLPLRPLRCSFCGGRGRGEWFRGIRIGYRVINSPTCSWNCCEQLENQFKKEKEWLLTGRKTLTEIRKLLKRPNDLEAQSMRPTVSEMATTSLH